MKDKIIRIAILIVIIALVIGLIVFANIYRVDREKKQNEETKVEETSDETEEKENVIDISNKKILIAYFSLSGNTEMLANIIKENVIGDIYKIETINTYPEDYTELTEIAKKEKEENARPKLKNKFENIADYDTIILGYPIWWGTMPMSVYTFIEQYDLNGKTIIPFCTHEGSMLGSTQEDIKNKLASSTIIEGLAIKGNEVQQEGTKDTVKKWLSGLKEFKEEE